MISQGIRFHPGFSILPALHGPLVAASRLVPTASAPQPVASDSFVPGSAAPETAPASISPEASGTPEPKAPKAPNSDYLAQMVETLNTGPAAQKVMVNDSGLLAFESVDPVENSWECAQPGGFSGKELAEAKAWHELMWTVGHGGIGVFGAMQVMEAAAKNGIHPPRDPRLLFSPVV